MGGVEQILGACLMLWVLLDVFLTVLYARIGTGILSDKLARFTWRLFRLFPAQRRRAAVLSFCGPMIVVLLVIFWSLLLAIGAGLVIHPELGSGVRASSGDTPDDLLTAIYVGGSSLSIVGAGDFAPHTAAMKLFFLITSVVGTSVISLTLTYIMQVYVGLRERNGVGLKLHAMSSETGDAAELLAALFPLGQFSAGYNNLSELAGEMAEVKEAHHFYPILFYFPFREAYYSVSRTTLVTLDSVSLIRSSFAEDKAGWLKASAAVQQVWSVSLMLVSTLDEIFIDQAPKPDSQVSEQDIARWRRRHAAAMRRLREAGVPLAEDEAAAADLYIKLRRKWEPLTEALAPAMACSMAEIDPATEPTPRDRRT